MALTTPAIYNPNRVRPRRSNQPISRAGTKAPIKSAYTGNRAEQVISGATMMVARRSFQLAIVRVAMTPGMAQAKLESSGIKARPDKPTLPIRLSSRKAARGR